jgi:hypothetical protein
MILLELEEPEVQTMKGTRNCSLATPQQGIFRHNTWCPLDLELWLSATAQLTLLETLVWPPAEEEA